MTDIGRLVRDANPVWDESTALTDDELTALLLLAESRSTDMDVKELVTPVEPEPPRQRGWLVAAASFAVILLIVGAVLAFGGGDTETPPATVDVAPTTTAGPPTTTAPNPSDAASAALAVVAAYADAIQSGDPSAVEDFYADGFTYRDDGFADYPETAEGWAMKNAFWATEGDLVVYSDCTATANEVNCVETWEGPTKHAIWPFPWRYNVTFTIDNGLIAGMTGFAVTWPEDEPERRQAIVDWVAAFDPVAAATMGSAAMAPGEWPMEAAPLYGHYAPIWAADGRPSPGDGEFAEAMISVTAFEDALNSGSIDSVAALLAEDFEEEISSGVFGTVETYLVNTSFWMEAGTLTAFTECRPADQRIVCAEIASGPVQDAISPWEWTTATTIEIVDGKVAFLRLGQFAALDSVDSVQAQLSAWVLPQDAAAARLIEESPSATNQTTEAARAWLEWAPKWVAAGRP